MTDEELEALALSADPYEEIGPDAVPIDLYLGSSATLPSWYMAPVMCRSGSRWRSAVILGVVAAFVLIEAFGLCSTYGQLPWH